MRKFIIFNFIFMDYKTSKELLLGTKVLTEQQADEILDMWEVKPRAYHDLLKVENAFQLLHVYVGVPETEEDFHHYFEPTNIHVPSVSIAEKFFAFQNESIITRFITILNNLSVPQTYGERIYAWPYLTKECISALTMFQLFWVIGDWRYVFNFEDDKHGNLFDSLYRQLPMTLPRDVLVANSFNIMGWMNYARRYSPAEFNKHMLMSNHCIALGCDTEAMARKFYIIYRLDIVKELNDLDMRIAHRSNTPLN